MASFSVNCSFTFHNFAWSVMEKKISISRHKLQQGNVTDDCFENRNIDFPMEILTRFINRKCCIKLLNFTKRNWNLQKQNWLKKYEKRDKFQKKISGNGQFRSVHYSRLFKYILIYRAQLDFFFDVYECNGGKPNAIFRSKKVQET